MLVGMFPDKLLFLRFITVTVSLSQSIVNPYQFSIGLLMSQSLDVSPSFSEVQLGPSVLLYKSRSASSSGCAIVQALGDLAVVNN